MIENDRQLKTTVSELKKFQQAREAFVASEHSEDPWIIKAQVKALDSQIEDLAQQISEYRLLLLRGDDE